MCWFFGRQISDGLSETGDVPVGLIASDWGGTGLSQWTPADAVADCAITRNCTGKGWIGGDHYNAYAPGWLRMVNGRMVPISPPRHPESHADLVHGHTNRR